MVNTAAIPNRYILLRRHTFAQFGAVSNASRTAVLGVLVSQLALWPSGSTCWTRGVRLR